MGDEGQFTMYIDAVKKEFAVNSITEEKRRFPLTDDIRTMFHQVRYQYENYNQKKCL